MMDIHVKEGKYREKKGEQREGGVGAKRKRKNEVGRRSRLSKLNQQAGYKLSQIACLSLNDRLHTYII